MLELNLIEEFHWTFEDVKKIPYKTLQMFSLVRKQRHEAQRMKTEIEAAKNLKTSSGSSYKQSTRIV